MKCRVWRPLPGRGIFTVVPDHNAQTPPNRMSSPPQRHLIAFLTAAVIAAGLLQAAGLDVRSEGAAAPSASIPDSARKRPIFPDEFSELDEDDSSKVRMDPVVTTQMERARQRYLGALSLIEKADTSQAAEQFESAIALLNDLATYPDIESNADFTDLVQAVIEDYETYVKSIDNLNPNTSIFILRDRLFEEADARQTSVEPITTGAPPAPLVDVPNTTIPLTYNEYVRPQMSFMAEGRGRRFMKTWIERTGRWFPTLKRIAKEEQMPEEIVHLAMMESALNPEAVSRAKAVGMWQFMRATGEEYDLNVNYWMDERRDPEKATRASMRFLKDLYNDLGDWHLALAAYNCGAGGVRRAIRKSGLDKPTFWQIREFLPKETREYVPLYIATTLITLNRDKYGFPDDSLSFHNPYEYETVTINEPVSLSALAKCASVPLDSLRALNTELVRGCTPPQGPYKLKLYPGMAQDFMRRFAALGDDEKQIYLKHTVSRGETLASISAAYGVSAVELSEINGITGYRARLKSGSVLRVPVRSVSAAAATDLSSSSPPAPQAVRTDTSVKSAAAPKSMVADDAHSRGMREGVAAVYVVERGDNLSAISSKFNIRIADLRNWNNIPYDRDGLQVGDTLIVGTPSGVQKARASADITSVEQLPRVRTQRHTVRKGENLKTIANRYSMTVARLAELNNVKRTARVKPGAILLVEAPRRRMPVQEIAASAPKRPKSYRVRKGDTLAGIADRFSLSVAEIRRKNPSLRNSSMLRAGQVVRLN
ncbi:MAG: LysM peptidoglycan-binding domain-containing protein [Candidatus Kapabacteria bacterium]|nr:LysM peptidoglycan-binding domain-containing protein [Candidatus Kapabacteria bacterium]